MDALYQRLKELDPDTFQRLCAQLLKDRHPGMDFRHVEGASGDEGLDLFLGILEKFPVIWQCKAFPNGVGKVQKEQIRKSLRSALKNFKPSQWILCLSVDMGSQAYRWFQKLQKSYEQQVQIGLFSATDIVHELMHRHSLRDHFFPGATINIADLKRLVTKTGELTDDELEKLNESNLEDYLDRMRERDARFTYELLVRNEGGPERQIARPGLVLSVQKGNQRLNVFARDHDALRRDPPKLAFKIKDGGIKKLRTLMSTGETQKFTSTEFTNLQSNWTFIEPLMPRNDYEVIVGPSPSLTSRRIKARVTFILEKEKIEYEFLEFAPVRAGADEAEIRTIITKPFQFSLILPIREKGEGTFSFTSDFVGEEVRKVHKFLTAVEILRKGGDVIFYDLERGRELFRAKAFLPVESQEQVNLRSFVADLVKISDTFSVDLYLPSEISDEDEDAFAILKSYVESLSHRVDDLTISLVKSPTTAESLRDVLLLQPTTIRFEREFHDPKPRLFGKVIDTGPCAMTLERVVARNASKISTELEQKQLGDSIEIAFDSQSEMKYELIRKKSNS